ncbi:MAG: hypothetical protein KAQ83_04120 [Nanoarchaeota archaeon]|nr:hypothetical protein [Nanoarchaeota archaeon]
MPNELRLRMKEHTEIRWSEVVRKAINQKINDLEIMEMIAQKSKLTEKDVKELANKIDSSLAKRLGLK